MQDTNICHVSPVSGNIITPKGKLFYAQYMLEPQNGKYSVDICFKPGAELKGLKNAMGKIALENLDGDTKQAMNFVEKRFIDPNNKPSGGKPAGAEFEGWISVRASSSTIPDFVYPNGQKIPSEDLKKECYSGRWARVTLNPYWMDKVATDKDTGKQVKVKGLFLTLVNVQLLDHDTPLGFVKAAGSEEFGAVEGIESGSSNAVVTAPSNNVDALFG